MYVQIYVHCALCISATSRTAYVYNVVNIINMTDSAPSKTGTQRF